jgi:predicted pyridoxine 5'-phosphate oxidase superfamily flavin-nucleotide-binding protein
MDSLLNIVSNPHIGIVFIVPGLGETLRVNGRASIVNDEALLLPLEAQGKVPQLAIMVEVEECYIHCAKAFLRSKLWEPGTWPDLGRLPSPGQIIVDHAKVEGVTTEDVNRSLKESYEKRLY